MTNPEASAPSGAETCPDCGRPKAISFTTWKTERESHCWRGFTRLGDVYSIDPCRVYTITRLRAENEALRARVTELEQRLARVAELAHDRDGDTLEWRSERLGKCASVSWDHMEEAFCKDPLKRRATLKWAKLATQLTAAEERAAKHEQLVSALQWLPAGTVLDFTDVDGFFEEVRAMGWDPAAPTEQEESEPHPVEGERAIVVARDAVVSSAFEWVRGNDSRAASRALVVAVNALRALEGQ